MFMPILTPLRDIFNTPHYLALTKNDIKGAKNDKIYKTMNKNL